MSPASSIAQVRLLFSLAITLREQASLLAGKDRTGVFAAVILMVRLLRHRPSSAKLNNALNQLLGVPDEQIAADFALTTIGLQPAFPLLAERFMAVPAFRDNWKGTLNLGAAR